LALLAIALNQNKLIDKTYVSLQQQQQQQLQARPLQTYGSRNCTSSISLSKTFIQKAALMRSVCGNPQHDTRIGTVSVHFDYPNHPNDFYQQALTTHVLHSQVHNSRVHVLCDPIIDFMWNKQAFMLKVMMDELAKPPKERLEWLLWADRDTVILDYCRSPAFFIPEAHRRHRPPRAGEKDRNINILVTNDPNGLNAGVFIMRVHEWSVNFLSDVIAFRHFRPDVQLPYVEQTAMEILLREGRYKDNAAYIPQEWINPYTMESVDQFFMRQSSDGLADWMARRGDFLLHFAGVKNKSSRIAEFSNAGERLLLPIPLSILRNVTTHVEQFWADYDKGPQFHIAPAKLQQQLT
jgi:hypothetical protein